MRIYTTPVLNITIKRRDGTVVTDLDFEYLIFTIKEGKNRLDKRIESSAVVDGKFQVVLTQEETGQFSSYGAAKAEINFFKGSSRVGTIIKSINIDDNLIEEVITDG